MRGKIRLKHLKRIEHRSNYISLALVHKVRVLETRPMLQIFNTLSIIHKDRLNHYFAKE